MSIFPAADLVTGVANAADPRKLAVAMQRLTDVSDARAPSGVQFASALKSMGSVSAPASRMFPSASPAPSLRAPGVENPASEAARKFEAFVVQSFLEIVLPKEEHGAYGQGAAGGVWRSMMAEQLGNQIAKSGGVGLQKMLDRSLSHRHALPLPVLTGRG